MNKIEEILNKNFDTRMGMAVVSYIIDKGLSQVQTITDDQIKKLEGNAFMTDRFVQSLVQTAREITNKCSFDEICDYIFDCRLYAKGSNGNIYKEDFSEETWQEFCYDLDVNNDEDVITIWHINEV